VPQVGAPSPVLTPTRVDVISAAGPISTCRAGAHNIRHLAETASAQRDFHKARAEELRANMRKTCLPGREKLNAVAGGDQIRTLWSQSSTPHRQDAIWRRRTRWLA
jgi:hypothetical protein